MIILILQVYGCCHPVPSDETREYGEVIEIEEDVWECGEVECDQPINLQNIDSIGVHTSPVSVAVLQSSIAHLTTQISPIGFSEEITVQTVTSTTAAPSALPEEDCISPHGEDCISPQGEDCFSPQEGSQIPDSDIPKESCDTLEISSNVVSEENSHGDLLAGSDSGDALPAANSSEVIEEGTLPMIGSTKTDALPTADSSEVTEVNIVPTVDSTEAVTLPTADPTKVDTLPTMGSTDVTVADALPTANSDLTEVDAFPTADSEVTEVDALPTADSGNPIAGEAVERYSEPPAEPVTVMFRGAVIEFRGSSFDTDTIIPAEDELSYHEPTRRHLLSLDSCDTVELTPMASASCQRITAQEFSLSEGILTETQTDAEELVSPLTMTAITESEVREKAELLHCNIATGQVSETSPPVVLYERDSERGQLSRTPSVNDVLSEDGSSVHETEVMELLVELVQVWALVTQRALKKYVSIKEKQLLQPKDVNTRHKLNSETMVEELPCVPYEKGAKLPGESFPRISTEPKTFWYNAAVKLIDTFNCGELWKEGEICEEYVEMHLVKSEQLYHRAVQLPDHPRLRFLSLVLFFY